MSRNFSIAHRLSQAELLLAGLAVHGERLAKRGLDADFINGFSAVHQRMSDAYAAQQAYKARYLEKGVERRVHQRQLQELCREARKMIKVELPREAWREFGITDRR
jgi:hypothetical protein